MGSAHPFHQERRENRPVGSVDFRLGPVDGFRDSPEDVTRRRSAAVRSVRALPFGAHGRSSAFSWPSPRDAFPSKSNRVPWITPRCRDPPLLTAYRVSRTGPRGRNRERRRRRPARNSDSAFGEKGVGEHGEGDPAEPGRPASDLVLIESGQALAGLEVSSERSIRVRRLAPGWTVAPGWLSSSGRRPVHGCVDRGGRGAGGGRAGRRRYRPGPSRRSGALGARAGGELLPGPLGRLLDQCVGAELARAGGGDLVVAGEGEYVADLASLQLASQVRIPADRQRAPFSVQERSPRPSARRKSVTRHRAGLGARPATRSSSPSTRPRSAIRTSRVAPRSCPRRREHAQPSAFWRPL